MAKSVIKKGLAAGLTALLLLFSVMPHVMTYAVESSDAEMLEEVMPALDNDNCVKTLAALLKGETVTYGSKSETAAGVQQTLVDFGCDIEVDGDVGPATIEALNQVLQGFGMKSADKVDAELYAQLMPLLLITKDEEAAREILDGYYESSEDTDQFTYLKGCALYIEGRYCLAQEAFEASGYQDYEERAAACVQTWPSNGELWHNSDYYSNSMYLTFTVNNEDSSEGMDFEIYTQDGTLVSIMFLTGSGSVTTSLPGGVYRIRDIAGHTWYGWKDTFGLESGWEYMTFYEFDDDEYATDLAAGYEWTITINVTEAVPGSTDVGSTTVPWDLPDEES